MHIDTLKFYKYTPVKKPMYQDKFCSVPFDMMQIDADGDVQLCGCQHDMPYTIGNIYKDSLQAIWNGELAGQVRQAVVDGDFTYCNWNCSTLPNLPKRPTLLPTVANFPPTIKLDIDRSCNLKCPSCRENVIIEKNSEKINKQIEIFEEIKQWGMSNANQQINIIPSAASGDLFASHSGLNFLKSLADYPYNNLKIKIVTNGTLINKNRELLSTIKHLIYTKKLFISLDAATPETYSVVRGGDWQEVMSGIEFLKSICTDLQLGLNFCIQKNNWHEIEQFADLAHQLGAVPYYQKLLDWGHWTIDWWHDNNVFDRKRESFDLSIQMLRSVRARYPGIPVVGELHKYL
jgi:radical SAM protein with 4Fe4S-binding SPASM domain